jgi:hypothetical protein
LFRIQPQRLQDIQPLVEDFLAGEADGARLEVVYAFRQVVAPLAINCFNLAGSSPRLTLLDLDDDECSAKEQIATLEEEAGAAVAVGVAGLFMETHPNPAVAMSDGPNAVPLKHMRALLETLQDIDRVTKKHAFLENNFGI